MKISWKEKIEKIEEIEREIECEKDGLFFEGSSLYSGRVYLGIFQKLEGERINNYEVLIYRNRVESYSYFLNVDFRLQCHFEKMTNVKKIPKEVFEEKLNKFIKNISL